MIPNYIKNILIASIILLAHVGSLDAQNTPLSISGTYLGGGNFIAQNTHNRAQFDLAVNVDFNYQIAPHITGVLQLQGGAGQGSLGFVGPQLEVTDLNIEIHLAKYRSWLTMGSFDTPLGQQVGYLTNNADSFANPLLLNDLLYSALAGPVGTLNTVGLMHTRDYRWGHSVLAFTNGTGENAVNEGGRFETLVGAVLDKWRPNLALSMTYLTSDDRRDAGNIEANGFNANTQLWMADIRYTLASNTILSAYIGQGRFGDGDSETKDSVTYWAVDATKPIGPHHVAARISQWLPEDADGSDTGVSTVMPSPGLYDQVGGREADVRITRYQLGGGIALEDALMLKAELTLDQYDIGKDVAGVLVYLNGKF